MTYPNDIVGFHTLFIVLIVCVSFTGVVLGEMDDIVIMIADFQGPDPYMVPVTESFYSWFCAVGEEEEAFRTIRVETPEDGSFEEKFESFREQGVDLLLFGQYDLPGTHVRLVISAALVSGTAEGQTVHMHLDREGTFPLTELVPGSEPPDRVRFIANSLTAFVCISRGSMEEGLGYLEKALENEDSVPDDIAAFAYSLRSLAHNSMGDASLALQDADYAVEMDPDGYLNYLYRGNAREMLGDIELALDDYLKVYELEPDTGESLQHEQDVRAYGKL